MMKKYKNILINRQDAAKKLQDVIPMQRLKDENWRLIALSRGGLELAYQIRSKYKNSIDFLFSEAILAPNNSECEIARVCESEEIVINEKLVSAFGIKYDYIYGEARRKHEEKILSYIYQYRKGRPFSSMHNQIVLLVDEGSETGLKFMTALKAILAMKPKAVYIATPVVPSDVLDSLEPFADDVFFLYNIDDYVETSLYYEELEKIDEERIEKILGEKNEV
ncbi:MAG: phosphoribosyltransferase [Sulfurimonas sp. RIFOXYD12_FULL_33_39]|nr:MAG: phosphoribosyltransferase [Sulfurimonas sp. RIFCSPLOWO2_12_FULL_34_6]OHE10517.1 MAG: phosphoribosyltransferase [Sulfurimonas sp. RIFOXYD12_FULL_33_39]OHE14976.1 MAG: phosphoribosyltransferase [Sulfurimonas sp. RIFOXYD2_FULL_34_21]DAB28039.1 MAG TPA: phosphoribosyltransferase [Sulfurimonas sp. UBA10385]